MSANVQTEGGRHALTVPNTDEGRAFLASLRRFANYDHIERIRRRARGPRAEVARADGERVARYFQDLPARHAKAFAVYIDTRAQPWQVNASKHAAESIERHFQNSRLANARAERAEAARDVNMAHLRAVEAELARVPAWIRRFFNWLHRGNT